MKNSLIKNSLIKNSLIKKGDWLNPKSPIPIPSPRSSFI